MLYQNEPLLQLPATLIQLCIDVDELMTLWRHRHALMVHRMIGRKLGTLGGWWVVGWLSGGVVFAHLFFLVLHCCGCGALFVLLTTQARVAAAVSVT